MRSIRHVLILVMIVSLASLVLPVAVAQDRSHSHGPPGGDRPMTPEEIQARVARTEEFLQRMDTNKNGMIDADEVNGPAKYIMDRMSERLGKPIQYPVSISQLKQLAIAAYTAQSNGAAPSSPPPSASSSTSPSTKPGTPVSGMLNAPSSMAFGTTASVPGFGDPAALSKAAAGPKPSASSASIDRDTRRKIQELAAALFKMYDKDENHRIERSEWPVNSRYGTFDEVNLQGHSTIHLESLVEHLTNLYLRGLLSLDDAKAAATTSGRFLTPVERLPKDTPRWFQELDRDHDGQITMAEFTREWSPEEAAEFERLDLNHDGVITPSEAIKAEKSR
jgi:Ca2+-binding EF-hand superfamily protein